MHSKKVQTPLNVSIIEAKNLINEMKVLVPELPDSGKKQLLLSLESILNKAELIEKMISENKN